LPSRCLWKRRGRGSTAHCSKKCNPDDDHRREANSYRRQNAEFVFAFDKAGNTQDEPKRAEHPNGYEEKITAPCGTQPVSSRVFPPEKRIAGKRDRPGNHAKRGLTGGIEQMPDSKGRREADCQHSQAEEVEVDDNHLNSSVRFSHSPLHSARIFRYSSRALS